MTEPCIASLSLWGLFIQADWIVKMVIIGLVVSSLWSWSIVFEKWNTLRVLKKDADKITEYPVSLDKGRFFSKAIDPFSEFMYTALKEKETHSKPLSLHEYDLIIQKMEYRLVIHLEQQRESLSSQVGVLASIGSTAPFVGLFGTVWGIMNSFQSIALSKNTSLAVVAPGIAEALFATAIGLVVAIPAVIAYNRISLSIQSYLSRLENFGQEIILQLFPTRVQLFSTRDKEEIEP